MICNNNSCGKKRQKNLEKTKTKTKTKNSRNNIFCCNCKEEMPVKCFSTLSCFLFLPLFSFSFCLCFLFISFVFFFFKIYQRRTINSRNICLFQEGQNLAYSFHFLFYFFAKKFQNIWQNICAKFEP